MEIFSNKNNNIKRRGVTGAGEEESRRRRKVGQELEAQNPLGLAGTGTQVETGRGEE